MQPGEDFFILNASQSVCVPFSISCLGVSNGNFTFSGAIYASTGCDEQGGYCETGTVGPATRAEMTLSCVGTDFYDVRAELAPRHD